MVEDGREGLIFPMGDVNALTDRLSLLLNNPGLVQMMKESIRPTKTIQDNAREMDILYRETFTVRRTA
jgi:hypothetical protein